MHTHTCKHIHTPSSEKLATPPSLNQHNKTPLHQAPPLHPTWQSRLGRIGQLNTWSPTHCSMRARKTEQALGRAGLGEDAWCSSARDSLHQAGRGEEERKSWGVTKESRFSAAVWVCRVDSQLWNLECKATTKAEKRRGREEDPSHAAQTTP